MYEKFYSNLRKSKAFFQKVNINPLYLIAPAVLSILSAIFEGISVSAVIPLLRGIFTMDFAFVKDLPVLRGFAGSFISVLNLKNTQIFAVLLGVIFSAGLLKNILRYFSSLMVCFQVRKIANNLRSSCNVWINCSWGVKGDCSGPVIDITLNTIAQRTCELHHRNF